MPVERLLATPEAEALVELARTIAEREIEPRVVADEADGRFPREVFATLGAAGLLALPYPERFGGGGQPYEVYLQVLEEIAYRSASVAVGVSVHSLSCYPLAHHGSDAQRDALLPRLLSGVPLGAYSLSEPHAGSDPAALTTTARREPVGTDGYRLAGTKAWVTHGGVADYYTVFARTSADRSGGISCFLVDGDSEGLIIGAPERKMGLTASPTTQLVFDHALVPTDRLMGGEGAGLRIALSALDAGRLGIAACAVGLAQRALDDAVAYARERQTFGRAIIDHQGLGFLLADMAAAVDSARATTLSAARLRDTGRPAARAASIAKLVATDAAMRVTENAVQVLGGAGYTKDYPVERYMREAKVFQIFEGTNQIQRMVIARDLARG
ncbi:acyl-CoA dehydrogenase family protein [Frankia sp. AgKG'84/4]|uniref:acyl-CoA dehydrogenase family protein n=1 Tax=Frankia sp. AgKG'84/4 TaxID=573490 RepID=UPI00200E9EC6|nr:acyl-CoA dehydrogenase family protein [Frankia sp. AgKG'84/4]MCL9794136.1 acyl-CoA dehydrogenase family protein [Frankia sp. AgKG'84/4]